MPPLSALYSSPCLFLSMSQCYIDLSCAPLTSAMMDQQDISICLKTPVSLFFYGLKSLFHLDSSCAPFLLSLTLTPRSGISLPFALYSVFTNKLYLSSPSPYLSLSLSPLFSDSVHPSVLVSQPTSLCILAPVSRSSQHAPPAVLVPWRRAFNEL